MNGLMLKIKETIPYLNPSQKHIGNYILEHRENIVGITISELSTKCEISKASVIQFCKSIGFNGFREFSLELAADFAIYNKADESTEYMDIKVGSDIGSIIKNVSNNNIQAIEESLSLIDTDTVVKAYNMLAKAKRICLFGIGASGIVALDAQHKLMRINKACVYHQDSHVQLTVAANTSPEDVAVVISWSGETMEMIEAAKAAKENGAAVIAITRVSKAPLTEYADVNLFLNAPETSIRSGALSSRIAQMNMFDILYICLVTQDYSDVKKYLDRTRQEVRKILVKES